MVEPARAKRRGILSEYVYFIRTYRMWWLVPVIAVAAILGTVVVMGGSKAALLIYALF